MLERIALVLMLGSPAALAADLAAGLLAYQDGRYGQALEELHPLGPPRQHRRPVHARVHVARGLGVPQDDQAAMESFQNF